LDERLLDNHLPTIPTLHPTNHPPCQPLDHRQNSTTRPSHNGRFPHCPIHHQSATDPQQLQTISASHHPSRNLQPQWNQDLTGNHTPRQHNTITTMNQWLTIQLAYTSSSQQISMETMDKDNPNPLCQTRNVNPTENTSLTMVSQCTQSLMLVHDAGPQHPGSPYPYTTSTTNQVPTLNHHAHPQLLYATPTNRQPPFTSYPITTKKTEWQVLNHHLTIPHSLPTQPTK